MFERRAQLDERQGSTSVRCRCPAEHRKRVAVGQVIEGFQSSGAGRCQRVDPQATVGLDAHHHLGGIVDELADDLVETADPVKAFG